MRIITYECEECGTEVVVTETGGTSLRPIYCCGLEITEVSSVPNPGVQKKSRTPAKGVKKVAAKGAAKSRTKAATKVGTARKKAPARKSVKK